MKKHLLIIIAFLLISISSQARVLTTCTSPLPTVTGITTGCQSATINLVEYFYTIPGGFTSAANLIYNSSVGGVGSSYSINIPTPILTQNTVFWISSKIPSCDESSRVPVLVTFDPITNFIPPLPTITGINSISGGAQITLSNAQRFKYYDVSIGGIALTTFNGSSVTICSQKQNNVFWFISYNDYCESERVEMNFNNLLVQPPTIVGINTVCGNTIFNLTATGGDIYSLLQTASFL